MKIQITKDSGTKIITALLFPFFVSLSCLSVTQTNLPNKSLLIIDGGGGCLAYEHYNYTILHYGTNVIAKSQTGFDKKISYFNIPYNSYCELLQKYFLLNDKLKTDYGSDEFYSTGEWYWSLTIEHSYNSEIISKEINYTLEGVEDKHFLKLLYQISLVQSNATKYSTFDIESWRKTKPTSGWTLPGITPVD